LRRVLADSGPVDLSDLIPGSRRLRSLAAIESGAGLENSPLRAYSELAQGRLEKAMEIARANPEAEARMLRLAAASDGASSELIGQALALPPEQGTDLVTVWAAVGLLARRKADASPFFDQLKQLGKEDAEALKRFVELLRSSRNAGAAEQTLDGLLPELRGQAYVMGIIALGKDAPPKWRKQAKQLLFASERPYFN
jgi:hypothetical protein